MNELILRMRDLAGDLRYCDENSLAATLLYEAANALESARSSRCLYCNNEARYVNEYGALTCGTCPIKHNLDSIRISDVPKLVGWTRDIVNAHREVGYVELDRGDIDVAAELIGRRPASVRDDKSLVAWPAGQPRVTRAGIVCNMWTGPCSCGAWHNEGK